MNCECSECERCIEHPIAYRGLYYNVDGDDGYKCTKHDVYNTEPDFKGSQSFLSDVVIGEEAEEHIKEMFRHPEDIIKKTQEGNLTVEWRF